MQRLASDLRSARRREIGGLLFGEHVESDLFRVLEATVQTSGGTKADFKRDPKVHKAALEAFFAKTGHNYVKYNYLGEWHSHPSFSTDPSTDDLDTMHQIVADPSVGANFAVLIIVKLTSARSLELSATAFFAGGACEAIDVVIEQSPPNLVGKALKAIVQAFTRKSSGRRVI
ncbi:MAG TPA: Mov34/MPN/PAD-1 family protein [Devosia sp.]|uniref:Mov34/MPN/PAD-1 family protein n=1 Tax=Devosia sp. TaxID=1871048 RepID=UPI002DDCF5FF|nr:Mov34/MPN/PAD-1 family protein [Devosia sp.]HEV2517193.1 Mov34/MPN/PAD-1 family protein [Devosia sp.]